MMFKNVPFSKKSLTSKPSNSSKILSSYKFKREDYLPPTLEGVNIDRRNVFIKYLPNEMTDSGLCAIFSSFGEITSYKVMLDPLTGNSLGYGFVHFSTPEEASNAVQKMNRVQIRDKVLLCKLSYGVSHNNIHPNKNLYIKPLPNDMLEDDLVELFSSYGNIVKCKLMPDKNSTSSTQIGFVMFKTVDEATYALANSNGRVIAKNCPPISVKYAESSTEKHDRQFKLFSKRLTVGL